MVIIHENMELEARYASEVIKDVYNKNVCIVSEGLENYWTKFNNTDSYYSCLAKIHPYIYDKYKYQCFLILCNRDFISINNWPNSTTDDWLYGFSETSKQIAVVSVIRLKGEKDSNIRYDLEISKDQYKNRFQYMVVHELGHIFIDEKHFKRAFYKNVKTGKELELGDHCDNNSCSMYQTIEVRTPDPNDEYLILREDKKDEIKHDSGLDDVLKRMRCIGYNWLCPKCTKGIN